MSWNQGGDHPPQGAYPQSAYPQGAGLPEVGRVSPVLYLILWWIGLVGGGVMTGIAFTDPKLTELVAVCWAPLLIGAIAFWVLIYKAWSAIQDGRARTTPGKAVGFLFIPLFNIYWLFVAIGSWGKEFNAFAERRGVVGARASDGLFVAHCVFSIVPVLSAIALFTGTGVILQMCRGINAVANRHAGGVPIATAHRR